MMRTLLSAVAVTALTVGAAAAADPLVSPAWLKDRLGSSDLVVIDLREPAEGKTDDPFLAGHIPGAVPAPYAKSGWRTTVDGVPGMLPGEAAIEALVGSLGIEEDDHVVVVSEGESSSDFGAAARVYWTLEVMGHQEISILEGGHKAWAEAGYEVAAGPAPAVAPTTYDATFNPALVATLDDVRKGREAGVPLVDARPVAQYAGTETPKNVGIAGTIPGAVSLPHNVLVKDGREVVSAERLASYRAEIGVPETGEQIAFCNTGHWAAVGWFTLNKVGGNENVRLYDGSMVEWAKVKGLETETGASRTVQQ
jgi:thiosulfate/3-mercaptopyruvate sulfurtransferase